VHAALSELDAAAVDTTADFLGTRVRLPVFISCMTGGSEGGFRANRELARAASAMGVAVGMGSIRILFEQPELFDHFHLKPLAPDVPVLANLGVVEVRRRNHGEIVALVRRLEADALAVHLNPGQELFQPDGDRDFRGTVEAIARLCATAPFPVIVKETGFGIGPALVRELVAAGAALVDIAGAGGTNWITVESHRLDGEAAEEAAEFASWGLPTGLILAGLAGEPRLLCRVLASGGIRTGIDVAKALALGAQHAGMALPLARAVAAGGAEGVVAYLERTERTLRRVMLLTGARDLESLRRGKVWMESSLVEAARALLTAEVVPSARGVARDF
jgi:isopentenyl-diphosphate Delta-isomerase